MSGFYASGIRQQYSVWEAAPTVVRTFATLSLALPAPPEAERATGRLRNLGIKMGLLVREGQQVQQLTCGGGVGQVNDAVSADLASVFGTPIGNRWLGFVFKPLPEATHPIPTIAEYSLVLVLAGITTLPQLVPAPSRYGNDQSFAASYLSALWVVPAPAP